MPTKTETVQIRVTPQEKARYVKAAERDGRSLTNWATRAMDKAAKEKKG